MSHKDWKKDDHQIVRRLPWCKDHQVLDAEGGEKQSLQQQSAEPEHPEEHRARLLSPASYISWQLKKQHSVDIAFNEVLEKDLCCIIYATN